MDIDESYLADIQNIVNELVSTLDGIRMLSGLTSIRLSVHSSSQMTPSSSVKVNLMRLDETEYFIENGKVINK